MTERAFAVLKQRVERLVDDPQERRKLLLQAVNADTARAHRRSERAIDYHHRRGERFRFLMACVAEVLPDIQAPGDMPMGQLIARVEPMYPDLADQLRELVGVGPGTATPQRFEPPETAR